MSLETALTEYRFVSFSALLSHLPETHILLFQYRGELPGFTNYLSTQQDGFDKQVKQLALKLSLFLDARRAYNHYSKVTDYLLKRGFNRTEEIFRQESKHLGPDGKPLQQLANLGPKKYAKSFNLLKEWVGNNLEIYKVRPHVTIPSGADLCSSSYRSFCGRRSYTPS